MRFEGKWWKVAEGDKLFHILNVTARKESDGSDPPVILSLSLFLLVSLLCRTANRKLHDSNDGLRSALENSYSKFNRSLVCHIVFYPVFHSF